MKKKTLLTYIFLCICFSIFSQSFIDPTSQFYIDANRWEILGYIKETPKLRPYSASVIIEILENVINSGSDAEALKASEYMKQYTQVPFDLALVAETDFSNQTSQKTNSEEGTVLFNGNVDLLNGFFMSYDFGVTGMIGDFTLPLYGTTSFDMVDDPARVGPVEINLNFNNVLSVGSKTINMTAGIARSSFGQYPDSSIVLDSTTFHAPFINVFVNRPKWNYSQSIYSLTATDNSGNGHFSEKYLVLHDATIDFLPILSFSYYETVIYGGKFNLPYLLPCPFMVSQAFGDFGDNLQIGMGLSYKPIHGLKLTGDIYVDDLSANDIARLHFDTKLIFASQFTATYVPENSIINRIYTETLILAPRMYAHSDIVLNNDGTYSFAKGTTVNFQNYTHNGDCIGTKIWPNSIACVIGSDLQPVNSLKISLSMNLVCHANVNETLENEYAKKHLSSDSGNKVCITDGSVLNFSSVPNNNEGIPGNQYICNEPWSYWNHLPFLEQDTKQYLLQCNSGISYYFSVSKNINCNVTLKNTFEYIRNDGVQNEIYPSRGIIDPTDEDVANALQLWRDAIIKDSYNDYLTLSIKVSF